MPSRRRLKVRQVVRINFEARPDWDDEGWVVLLKGSIGIVSERVSRYESPVDHAAVYFGCIDKTLHIEEIGLTVIDLDEKGRCCGRKPIAYKRPTHLFCDRCDKRYSPEGQQVENWAWKLDVSGNWVDSHASKHWEE